MAARKKTKRKKAKRTKTKKRAGKKVLRKKAKRPTAKKRSAAKKRVKAKAKGKAKAKRRAKAKPKATRAAAAAPKPVMAAQPPAGVRMGIVTHYFTHLQVAIVQIESGVLREGDTVHIKGHTSDFQQRVESMELDHVHVGEAYAGQSVGMRVKEHAREHDIVYKAA